jgi:hypothetical protein
MRWVQRNVAAFGGDPGNVMIFGQVEPSRWFWLVVTGDE